MLVIEDEPDTTRCLGAYFRASGLQVEHCDPGSVAHAIEEVHDRDASCVLIDVGLDGNGLDIVDALRHDRRTASVPVVMVTVEDRTAMAPYAAQLGAALVEKPFDVRDMFDVVAQLVWLGDEHTPAAARHEQGGPGDLVLSSGQLRDLLAKPMRGARRKTVGLAVVRIRTVDGAPAGWTAVESASRAMDRGLERGRLLGCSDTDEIAVLYAGVEPREAVAELERAGALVVGCVAYAGLATWPDQASTPDELYIAADAAAAEAEEEGSSVRSAR